MRNFKLKTGINPIHTIEQEIFERETFQKDPYYGLNAKNEPVQFAVCPGCDNPIEIIGLYKRLKNTDHPYGKHYPHSVYGLAKYNEQSYIYCPYSRKGETVTRDSRKSYTGEYEREIYNLMRDQFDRVIYVLSKQLDIKITMNTARKMLEKYVRSKGWLYPWATLNNLPWVLGHLSWAKSLYQQPVLKNSSLYEAIVNACPSAEFMPSQYYSGYEILGAKKGKYLNIEYCMINHKRRIENDINVETMDFLVRESNRGYENRFFEKQLTIDEKYFLNLVNLSDEQTIRNENLLKIAKEIMTEI